MTADTPAPTVSVVIPLYNGGAWIAATLDSLTTQTLADWEAIVVDDCGPDDGGAAQVAAWPDPRVRQIRMPQNGGPVRARNFGAAHARGRFIAGLDQDDLCRPERFARQVAYLDAHADIALVATQAEQLIGDTVSPMSYAVETTPMLVRWLTWIENPLVWSTVMVRSDIAHAMDPFTRPDILYAEDFDLYHRITAHGGIARLDTPLLLSRQHEGGASKRFVDTMQASATRVLTEAHADLLGHADSAAVADLLIHYNMAKLPVPDRATLIALASAFARLQRGVIAHHAPDAADTRRIERETALRWYRICRAGLRTGTLTLADIAAAAQPPLLTGGSPALLPSAAIGAVRRVRQTLAA